MTRRFVALLAAALVLTITACAGPGSAGTVTVLASWTGDEERAFRQVLDRFTAKTNIVVNYQGTRGLNQVLAADVQNGKPPDIAVLPNAGELAKYVRRNDLVPLDDVLGADAGTGFSPQWRQLQRIGGNHQYGVAVKADLKSLIWFNTTRPPLPKPKTWAELMTLTDAARQRGETPWCMGMAAPPASGWPGTDWIEDILLHQSGQEAYRQWVAGNLPWTSPQVRDAFAEFRRVAGTQGTVRGGASAALLTDFGDAAKPMFTDPPGCALEHQASFMMSVYQGYPQKPVPEKNFDFIPFPPFTSVTSTPSYAVSADLAGMFTDTPQARELIKFLAGDEAQRIWPALTTSGGGAFSASSGVPADVYGDPVRRRIATTLTGEAPLCFDASDLMPAAMSSAFHRAVLEFLADPTRTDELLTRLEQVRTGVDRQEWLTFSCGE